MLTTLFSTVGLNHEREGQERGMHWQLLALQMSIHGYLGKASLWLFFVQFLIKLKLIGNKMCSIPVAPTRRGFVMDPHSEQGTNTTSADACSISVCSGNDQVSSCKQPPYCAAANSQAVRLRRERWVAQAQPDCRVFSYGCGVVGGLGPANE